MPAKPKTTTTKQPTAKQQKIVETHQAHPDLNKSEIAALCDTDHSYVVRTMQKYGITQQDTEGYKRGRANVLAGLQHKILSTITDTDIKTASLLQRVTAAGILYDKERLETGKSTGNISLLIGQIEELQRGNVTQDDSQGVDS